MMVIGTMDRVNVIVLFIYTGFIQVALVYIFASHERE